MSVFRIFSIEVFAPDYCQNFISAQYLEKKLMELDTNFTYMR